MVLAILVVSVCTKINILGITKCFFHADKNVVWFLKENHIIDIFAIIRRINKLGKFPKKFY